MDLTYLFFLYVSLKYVLQNSVTVFMVAVEIVPTMVTGSNYQHVAFKLLPLSHQRFC